MFSMFLIRTLNFMLIDCHLPFDLQSHILCTILKHKNLKFLQFIDEVVINLISFEKNLNHREYKKKM